MIQALLSEGNYKCVNEKEKKRKLQGYHAYKAKNGLTLVNTGGLYRYNCKDDKFEHNQNALKHFLQAFEKFKVRGIFFVVSNSSSLKQFFSITQLFQEDKLAIILPYLRLVLVNSFFENKNKQKQLLLRSEKKQMPLLLNSKDLSPQLKSVCQEICPLDENNELIAKKLSVVYQEACFQTPGMGTTACIEFNRMLLRMGVSRVKEIYQKDELRVNVKISQEEIAPIWRIINGLPVTPLGRENFIDSDVLKNVVKITLAGILLIFLGRCIFYLAKCLIGKLKSKGQKKKQGLKLEKEKKKPKRG